MTIAGEFELRGVAHLIRPWGPPVRNLEELRRGIAGAPVEVIFHHAVQYQLRHPGAEELPPDDFSAWIGGVIQDAETEERLSFVVQGGNATPESLRTALLRVLDGIPAKRRAAREAPEDGAFHFLAAASLSYPAGILVRDAQALVDALIGADASVWFFHLIEEPWFGEGRAPLRDWVVECGNARLATWLEESAAAGLPIEKARAQLLRRWRKSRIGRQVAESTRLPNDVRREAGRAVVARLVRRRSQTDDAP